MKYITSFIALSVAISPMLLAETTDLGDIALEQALVDSRCNLRLMCVAAHPDDEDGATLALYRKKYGAQTFAVIATRGEGGQNEIGPELYNDLAVIRTREMMRASKITGAELHFLNLKEFGFSKSPEEAFAVWGHEETVRRLVRVIRECRPHVIISNHGTQKDHGHHQAVGIALQEAFDAAGDPSRFPELESEGLKPWKPAALYLRAWEETPGAVKINIGELDRARGKTYAEIAADALSEHKSQGMGFFIDLYLSGKIQPSYILVKSQRVDAHELSAPTDAVLFQSIAGIKVTKPGDRVRNTVHVRRVMRNAQTADANKWRDGRIQAAAAIALGLQLQGDVVDATVVPGQEAQVDVTLKDFAAADADSAEFFLEPADWVGEPATIPQSLRIDQTRQVATRLSFHVPASIPFTVPGGEHVFDPHFDQPQFDVVAFVSVRNEKHPIELRVPIRLEVAPRVTAQVLATPELLRRGTDRQCAFDIMLTNYAPDVTAGNLIISVAPGLTVKRTSLPFSLKKEGDQAILSVGADIAGNLEPRDYILNASVEGEERPAFGVARLVDLKIPDNIRVGVIQSYDNTFVNVLEKLHVPHKALTAEDFAAEKLDTFSAIIVDIRAYLVRDDLAANNQALLDYVARGGTALVMYQKTEEWLPEYAPYPITLSRNRVTREDAPVEVLAPGNPLFTTPNAITAADWSEWIQERGLYFPSAWDANFTPLIACNDPGENIPPGAMLIAHYGKGNYLYTALGLYRQVRELHPGALRLFANMLALGAPRN